MRRVGRDDAKIIRLPEEHDLQLSALYHQTEAPRPPAGLEQRILEAARQAAAETLRRKQSLTRRQVPLPLAAALLVLVGLAPLLLWHGYQAGYLGQAPAPVPAALEDEAGPPADEGLPVPESPERVEPVPEALAPAVQELLAIQALIETGRDAEAWERFMAFRMEFPGHRIPDALLDQLAEVRTRLLEDPGGR
jgi:hypothetical protein